jgi:hypothetical protein
MEKHEHTEVTHLVHMRVPYHLEPQQLELDSGAKDLGMDEFAVEVTQLGIGEEELKRIIMSAALLLNTGRRFTVGECLDTALIWERG